MSSSTVQIVPSAHDVRQFYELLVLLRILGPCVGPRTHGSSHQVELSYSPLQRFLDQLSWMCDCEPGGESVSAIALEATTDAPTYWVSTTYKFCDPIRNHLVKLLGLLNRAHGLSARDSFHLELEIRNICIEFAHKRVQHYSKLLVSYSEQCQKVLGSSSQQLSQDLHHLTGLQKSPAKLCASADQFRTSESLRMLSRRVALATTPSCWSMLRHYIGRLGSWHRAARTLVDYASKRPQLFSRIQVEVSPTPRPINVPRADDTTNLLSVLSRLFTFQEQLDLQRGIEVLQRLRRLDLNSEFRTAFRDKNFKPRVHAEVWLLEHFSSNTLRFLDDHPYVGCSKPSCYCCNLYMLNHPEIPMQRPCHGNVWTNWQSPLYSDSTQQSLDARLRDVMISKFKGDFRNQIIRPGNNYGRIPDTTTGITHSNA